MKDEEIKKGMTYTISDVDMKLDIFALKGIKRLYRSENQEYEIGLEYWRFCLPEDYVESGI
ncbi:MAG: hypothetical protein V2I31_08010 [Mariniphaga sp.]|nr:hypothetical protein [Mariniphaga sp.]